MLTVSESVVKNVQDNLFALLWKNRKDEIKRVVIYQSVKNGGINFVNFCTVVKAFRLAWTGRLLSASDDKWKAIPNYYFERMEAYYFCSNVIMI